MYKNLTKNNTSFYSFSLYSFSQYLKLFLATTESSDSMNSSQGIRILDSNVGRSMLDLVAGLRFVSPFGSIQGPKLDLVSEAVVNGKNA